MDDTFLRKAAALQANLKMLESQSASLTDLADMKELRQFKARLADYIDGHAAAGNLPRDPLAEISGRLAALDQVFQQAKSESRRLLDWKADWLESVPQVGLPDLRQAGTELEELPQQLAALQGRLRGMLDPRDWDATALDPLLHPELRICAETMPRIKLPKTESCADLYRFSYTTGKLHEQVKQHHSRTGGRIDELLQLHAEHLTKVTEAEDHLAKENFRSAGKVIQSCGDERFPDIDYKKVDSLLKSQLAIIRLPEKWHSVDKKNYNKTCDDLRKIKEITTKAGSELENEISQRAQSVKYAIKKYERKRKKKLIKQLIAIFIFIAAIGSLSAYVIQEEKKSKIAREAANAKAAEATAKAEQQAKEAEQQAKEAKAKAEREFEIAPGVKMSFCWCPAGEFLMGGPESEEGMSDDEDQVKVTLSKGFWMAKTEVTQAQWEAVMGENPSEFKGDNRPVENVSWNDAQQFLEKLNARLGNADGGKMVLPTEAQWEYAARANQAEIYAGGSLDEVAWYSGNSGRETRPVGTKKANAWGLHDMSGNVWEWSQDRYGDKLSGGTDPSGPSSGSRRVFRGGSWNISAGYCRVANRNTGYPTVTRNYIGFRVARSSVP